MSSDSRTPLQRFLDALSADVAVGRVLDLPEYLARFPGDDVSIAREYGAALGSAQPATVVARPVSPRGRPGEPGSRIGPYRVVRELGRGGQAIVYLAEDERLHRRVALKVLPGLGPGSEGTVQRFRREAEVSSQLDHPGICAVHDADVTDGIAYIAMRFIEGETLANLISNTRSAGPTAADSSLVELEDDPAPARPSTDSVTSAAVGLKVPGFADVVRLLEIVEKASRALHAAHEAGVIHRDIKPANIMVTPDGEPVIMDFGLARDEGSDTQTLTRTGELFGTPAYMSPEQITGQRIRLDRRTDVWSLGVTLYECLTLRRPFAAPTREALYQTIIADDPPDLRRANPAVPRDLKVVIETALEKNRDRRYQSAADFADELRRVRKLEPIRARAAGPVLRLLRWGQRNTALASTLTGLVVLVLIASALLSYGIGASGKADVEERLRVVAVAERDRAEAERNRAEAERKRLDFLQRDQLLRENIEDLDATLGTMSYGFGGEMDFTGVAKQALRFWRQFGLELGASSAAADAQRMADLHARNLELWRMAAHALRRSQELWGMPAPAGSFAPRDAELDVARRAAEAWIASSEQDPWYTAVDAASRRYTETGEDTFGPMLTDDALRARSAEDLFHLAGALFGVKSRFDEGERLLDLTIRRRPDSYLAQFVRGAIALKHVADGPAARAAGAAVSLEHLQVAVALRPRSGLARGLLAAALAVSGRSLEAVEAIEASTELEPDSALVWFSKARFYNFGQMARKAAAACQRALQIDPSFGPARVLLDQITDAEEGESGTDR